MAESAIPNKKVKLQPSIDDSGIEDSSVNQLFADEVNYGLTALHSSNAPDNVFERNNEENDEENENSSEILESDYLEKDTSIKFTENFLTLWEFKDYTNLFKEHNIAKAEFLSLTETSEIFFHINDSKVVQRILQKRDTLLKYLQLPNYVKADDVGLVLERYLKCDPRRKIWLQSPLDKKLKSDLSKFIVDNILHTQIRRATPIQSHEFRFWAAEICSIWTTENDPWEWFKPYIFNGPGAKKFQGRLFEATKAFNTKINRINNKVKNIQQSERLLLLEKEMKEHMAFIERSETMNECVLDHWNKTIPYRMEMKVRFSTLLENSKFFTNIDHVKRAVQEDFHFIAKKNFLPNYLSDLWEQLSCHIISVDITVPDIIQACQNNFHKLTNCTIEMRKDFAWELLSYKMIPTANSRLDEAGQSKRFKPSRSEAAQSFILSIEHQSSLITTISNHRQKMERLSLPVNPYVIVVKNEFKVSKAIAVVDNKRFECATLTEAIDLAFKFYIIEDRKYCKFSQCVWRFIQEYLYKLRIGKSTAFTTVRNFISKLNNELQNQENNSVIGNR